MQSADREEEHVRVISFFFFCFLKKPELDRNDYFVQIEDLCEKNNTLTTGIRLLSSTVENFKPQKI